ncbi:MAG: ABC transporter permease [Bacteroidales bacterium]|jgi:putative ABC transport system permease protein|nr:ABC transporter permease [Bacteroidales bacterium]
MNSALWTEIWKTIEGNKTRSILTGLGIAWGIFILILLVGMGKGFEAGVFKIFKGFSQSTIYVYAAATTMDYRGVAAGQPLFFTEPDLDYLKTNVPEIDLLSPEVSKGCNVRHDGQTVWYEIKGVNADYFRLRLINVSEGRLLHPSDAIDRRKVALIGNNVAEVLFDRQSPIGKPVYIQDEMFTVVGIIANNLQNQYEARQIYLPYQAFKNYIDPEPRFNTIVMSLSPSSTAQKMQPKIRSFLARRFQIHQNDDKAFYINSMEEQVKAFNSLFGAIRKFLWFMGVSTLLSGIIGVANIMYVSAKERTHEIGIRKAVGAKRRTIKAMFIYESVLITSVAGYVGMLLGIGALRLIGLFIEPDNLLLEKPSIDMGTAVAATLVLIIAGTFAGLKPAAYAANLNPIDSLRAE